MHVSLLNAIEFDRFTACATGDWRRRSTFIPTKKDRPTTRAPTRLWILNGDARGQGRSTRKYTSTRAALRGWLAYRRPEGHLVLITDTRPIDFTDTVSAFQWRHAWERPDFATRPDYQAHVSTCLESAKAIAEIHAKTHKCPWFLHTQQIDREHKEDVVAHAATIEAMI